MDMVARALLGSTMVAWEASRLPYGCMKAHLQGVGSKSV